MIMYTCILNHIYMQDIYVHMQDDYVYMQDNYVYMQDNYVYIITFFTHMQLKNLCSDVPSGFFHGFFP